MSTLSAAEAWEVLYVRTIAAATLGATTDLDDIVLDVRGNLQPHELDPVLTVLLRDYVCKQLDALHAEQAEAEAEPQPRAAKHPAPPAAPLGKTALQRDWYAGLTDSVWPTPNGPKHFTQLTREDCEAIAATSRRQADRFERLAKALADTGARSAGALSRQQLQQAWHGDR